MNTTAIVSTAATIPSCATVYGQHVPRSRLSVPPRVTGRGRAFGAIDVPRSDSASV